MAIDARYRVTPWEPLLSRAMTDREAAEELQFSRAPVDAAFSTRAWDAVYWLLAPNRRAGTVRDPDGLAQIAVFGAEAFPCGAVAGQGIPLRFVRPELAAAVAEHVLRVADGAFDRDAILAAGVYKAPWERDQLADYARVYRRAAESGQIRRGRARLSLSR